jgi:hypothetical protein
MKLEQKQALHFLEAIGVAAVFAFLYTIGGSEDFGGQKWLRRYLAPALFCIWSFFRSWDWKSVVALPLMVGALSMGYGATEFWDKIGRRALAGGANGTAFGLYSFLKGSWILGLIHVVMCIITSVSWGSFNPVDDAIVEQGVIGFAYAFYPALILKRKV